MTNLAPTMKRVCAYMVDIIIVMILSVLISSIPFFNKNMDEYQKKYDEYEEKYNGYTDFNNLLESFYEDNEITEEEYNELLKEEKYQATITENYEDKKISQGEYKKIITKIDEEQNNLSKEYNYILGKIAISDSLITVVCTLLYFGVIQYFLKGQTIGKKILNLKVVSASNKKINILNFILRSLIVNNVLLNLIGIIFLAYASKNTYTKVDEILNIVVSIIEAIIIFLVMTREDGRGIHDLLFNTKVVSTETDSTSNKALDKDDKKVIEANYKEESDKDGKQTKEKKGRRKK